jgi:hypothetical protein
MDHAASSRNNKRTSKCGSSDLGASAIPRKRSRTNAPATNNNNNGAEKSNSVTAYFGSYADMQRPGVASLPKEASRSEGNTRSISNNDGSEKPHRERTEDTRSDARLISEIPDWNDTNRDAALQLFCFSSFSPLGFYCITTESESRGRICKITSVRSCPHIMIFLSELSGASNATVTYYLALKPQ